MYHIAKFSDDSFEIVLEKWIDGQENGFVNVAFPPRNEYSSIRKFLRDKVPSRSTWPTFAVEILFSHGK